MTESDQCEGETSAPCDDERQLEDLFQTRYTDTDQDFMNAMNSPLAAPPCIQNWYSRPKRTYDWSRDQGQRGGRGRGGRDHRGGGRDHRGGGRDHRGGGRHWNRQHDQKPYQRHHDNRDRNYQDNRDRNYHGQRREQYQDRNQYHGDHRGHRGHDGHRGQSRTLYAGMKPENSHDSQHNQHRPYNRDFH